MDPPAGTSVCPGCGLEAPRGGIEPDRPLNASPECWALHGEALGFELAHVALVTRYHQLAVDAYGAQHAGPPTGQRYVVYSLVGLCLALERGWSGIDVRTLHQHMGPPAPSWPAFGRPGRQAPLTIGDVVAAGSRVDSAEGHAAAVERWADAVWEAWGPAREDVRALCDRLIAAAGRAGRGGGIGPRGRRR